MMLHILQLYATPKPKAGAIQPKARGNQCTFCPIPPGDMEKVHDDTGQECIKPYMQMNEETRGERHLAHIEYEQLVLQNDQRGTIDKFASGIGPNDSYNSS